MSDSGHAPSPQPDYDSELGPPRMPPAPELPSCDICGSTDLAWLRCKLICNQCHTILMTCGDL
ncbi:MAG TPA: hypothetical protein VGR59_07010 [Gemmatimonadaceae bacterium]|nr:hypothetical protein [Gemmatimonadaceae bacterium]